MAKGSVSFFPVNHDPWADLPKGPTEARQGPMSWTDYLPFVKEAVKIYGKEKLGGILGAVTAPGDALAGRLDPGTPEGLKRVQTLAGLAMGGPTKPQGAVGAGWQFPHDLALAYWKDVPHHKDALDLVSHMKETGQTIQEAAKNIGASEKAVDKLYNVFMKKPNSYSHPYNAAWSEHPATYGMDNLEVVAADELLEMMKNYGHTPQAAVETVKQYLDSPKEIAAYESAAKKLGDWAGPHGFKFGEVPPVEPKPAFPELSNTLGPKYEEPKTIPIEEALYPINWADLHSTVRRPGQEAAGPYADTLRRAEALGFNTNFPLYHGALDTKVKAPANPAEGIWGPAAEQYHSFGDPKKVKEDERGIFTTDTPEIAAQYSGGSDADVGRGQTFPLFANPKKTLAVDWNAVSDTPSYSGYLMDKLIEAAHKRKADALVVQGMRDMGGPQNQYVFLRPNVLRSQFAMFDPKKVESANLLHAGGLGTLPLFIPIDHDPFSEPTQ